jgi:hypothetical protein
MMLSVLTYELEPSTIFVIKVKDANPILTAWLKEIGTLLSVLSYCAIIGGYSWLLLSLRRFLIW